MGLAAAAHSEQGRLLRVSALSSASSRFISLSSSSRSDQRLFKGFALSDQGERERKKETLKRGIGILSLKTRANVNVEQI